MLVRVNTASIAADADQMGNAATKLQSATSSAANALRSCSGMAGIDPMAEEFALGAKTDGGYDQSAASILKSGMTLAKAVAGFEGYLISLAAGYRAVELAGATGGANQFISMTPTQISGSNPNIGPALGDEQRGTPQGEIMEWVENFLKDTAGIIIPTADTGKVSNAATAWSTYQTSLLSAKASVNAALPATLAAQFPQHGDVAAVQTKLCSLIDALADDAGSLSQGCTDYATSVDSIRGELLSMLGQLALEVAIDIGVGIALSFFTFGAGALAAAGKAAMTIARWIPRLHSVLLRLKALIMTARRTMAVMRRAAIEAIEGVVSGTVANAGTSLAFGNFSWEGLGGNALASGIGGAVAGPFSNIGSNITSRVGRITTRSAVDGVTGGAGGVAGEWAASQMTGQEFNLVMAALVGTAGGAAAGGLTSIKTPNRHVASMRPTDGGPSGAPSGGRPAGTSPLPTGGAPSAGMAGAGAAGGTAAAAGGVSIPSGGAPSGGAPAGGGSGTPAGGGSGVPSGGATSGGGSGAPAGGAPSAGGSGSSTASAGGAGTSNGQVDVPASLSPDSPAGGSPTSGAATTTPTVDGPPAVGPSADAPTAGSPAADAPGSGGNSTADGSVHAPVAGSGNTGVTATGGIPSGQVDLPASVGPDGLGAGSHVDGPASADGPSNGADADGLASSPDADGPAGTPDGDGGSSTPDTDTSGMQSNDPGSSLEGATSLVERPQGPDGVETAVEKTGATGNPNIDPWIVDGVDTRPYLDGSRPSFRKDTVPDTWKNAVEDSPDGVVRDPNPPYEVIDWRIGDRRAGVWDMGHLPDQRYRDALERYRNGDFTPQQFRDWYNNPDHYRPETPHNNRSNRYSDAK